jgi:predicted O-methyltransferase YrrM
LDTYSAARFLGRRIERSWRCLEIGSGMSTLWLAQRCAQVELLRAEIARRKVSNATIHYRWQAAEMCDFSAWSGQPPDFVLIDGGPRPQCLVAALAVVKPGGFVYVDNTDLASTAQNSRDLLEAHARAHDCTIWVFRGLVP